eukprot:TRINITY_DN16846_c1_g1_i2.p1 TRINITY_DN16846_c1_g1~~TRINITY_DN16846_c1_g1_i2.p1  ORF type:complete len:487 (-),score=79.03 TRINITY_DN16846_c1_g1_i2:80-1540(-)
MGKLKASSGRDVPVGVSGKQFCCFCICFLASILIVQVCVLVHLLRRLAEVSRLSVPISQSAAASELLGSSSASKGSPSRLRSTEQSHAAAAFPASVGVGGTLHNKGASGSVSSQSVGIVGGNIALASAIAVGSEAIQLFLVSFQKAAPSASLVLLVDQTPPQAELEAQNIDISRITFERIALPLPHPWGSLPPSEARLFLFKNWLEQHSSEAPEFIQLCDVEDVAFQADPFAWVASESRGIHLFTDEPSKTVSSGQSGKMMELCYGAQAALQFAAKPSVPPGYIIGNFADVKGYVNQFVDEMLTRSMCHKKGVSLAVNNFVAHSPHLGYELQLHDNRRGPVWTGGNVPDAGMLMDSNDQLINEDGYKYSVLHQYDTHEDLWKNLLKRHLKTRQEKLAAVNMDCSSFQVSSGDMRGFDLSHMPADAQEECCTACVQDPGCGSFVFSAGRKHCWLKVPGGQRTHASPGDDIMCGIMLPKGHAMSPGVI